MKKFKDLSRKEKINQALNYRAWRHYRSIKARYLTALRKNDIAALEYFENMGDDFRKIIENVYAFERAKLCGFDEPEYNEYGWVQYNIEVIKKIELCRSSIEIARTPSGKYTCGIEYHTGYAGSLSGPSIYGQLHDTEKAAEMYGLDIIKQAMVYGLEAGKTDSCGNYNSKLINDTLREIKMLRNPCVQLELF